MVQHTAQYINCVAVLHNLLYMYDRVKKFKKGDNGLPVFHIAQLYMLHNLEFAQTLGHARLFIDCANRYMKRAISNRRESALESKSFLWSVLTGDAITD